MMTTELGGARVAAFYSTKQGGTLPSGGGNDDDDFFKIVVWGLIAAPILGIAICVVGDYIHAKEDIDKAKKAKELHLSSPEHNKLTQQVSNRILNEVYHIGVKPADQIDIKNITITPQQVQQAQRDSAYYATQITEFVRNNVDNYILSCIEHQCHYRAHIDPICIICGKRFCLEESHPTVNFFALIKDKKLQALKKNYDLAVQQLEVQRRYNRLHKTK